MNTNTNETSGHVIATNETEAKADAAASFENTGSGNAPIPNEKGTDSMQDQEHKDAPAQQRQEPERALIPLDKIEVDEKKYPRDHVDEEAVAEYADAMKKGAEFPDIEVYSNSGTFFLLVDGLHRIEASRRAEKVSVWAKVYRGTEDDATLHALAANTGHGVRRSHADKRKAVMIVLQNSKWADWNDSEIARHCHVSPPLVKTVKDELAGTGHGKELDGGNSSIVERNGKQFLQKRKAAAKPLPAHVSAIAEMRELARSARASVIGDDPGLADRLRDMGSELHEILGQATGAQRMTEGLREPLNVYERERRTGIEKDEAFEEKGLATHAFNIGFGCGHQCSYCSSASVRCLNKAYGELQLKPSSRGFAVIDPKASDLISADKPKLTAEDTVMLSTCDDAWSPEARKYGVGRKCLEALLSLTTARVRILTKSAEVLKDLDVAKDDKDRVLVGLSLGIPESREEVAAAVEPNASPISERLKALKLAHDLKFPVYAMLCPCLPGVADSEAALTEMFKAVKVRGAEGIWLEPVNAKDKALGNTATALRLAGLRAEADAVDAIRTKEAWSKYATALVGNAIKVAEAQGVLGELKILLYPDRFTDADLEQLKQYKAGIVWLGKDKAGKTSGAAGADKPHDDTADTEGGAGAARTEAA